MSHPCPALPRVPLRAAFTLSTAVTSSVISAWLTAWVGSWWGVNAYHLLQLPEEWGSVQAALPSWVAWTVPYLGATLGEPGATAVLAGGVGKRGEGCQGCGLVAALGMHAEG